MIYRAHVAVLLAIPGDYWDAVKYTFGINASDVSEAVNIAVTAARNAVDRDGEYIGGVVVEALCQCINREEFNGYEKYFLKPINEKGIFYVSGVTSYSISKERAADAAAELEKLKESIERCGVPVPSFIHPKLLEEPPTRVRMLCSICGHWVEVSNFGLVCSFIGGLDTFSAMGQEAIKAADVAGPFVRRHLSQCSGHILGIQEDDERWNALSAEFREDID